MSTVKISELPLITHLNTDTTQSLSLGVDLVTGVTGKMTLKTLAEGLYSNDILNVGTNQILFPNVVAQFSGSSGLYLQMNLQNFDGDGSGDIVITADNGTNANNFVDLGINGSTFSDPTYSAMESLDGYLFVNGPTEDSAKGNLTIGTISSNAVVKFSPGGTTREDIVALITKTGLTMNGASYITFNDGSVQSKAASPANYSQAAFAVANSASSNTVIIQGVNATQNTKIDDVNLYASYAYATANAEVALQAGLNVYQNTNIAAVNTYAGSAYNKANNALANTSGTFAGDLTITGNTSIAGIVDIIKSDLDPNVPFVHIIASDDGSYVAPSNSYYMLHITGKSNNSTRFVLDSFGANTYPLISGRMGRGSASTPAAASNNDVLMRIVGNGYTGTQFPSSSPTKIDFVAAENFSDTNRGTIIEFWNTPKGSNTIQKIASFNANEVNFTGTVIPEKGFVFIPKVLPGAQTAITIDFATDSTIKASCNADVTIALTNYTYGKIVEVWLTNTGAQNRTVTHGCTALNSTTKSTTFTLTASSSAYMRYFSIDGDNGNTFVTITA